ncbi:hypothetical protein [Prevotella sp. AGR2160]|uniref:hypothetical protein n=1 Tax=Prevotella sp. AGR2160 TaxID=1280674 RepID=UPI0018CA7389|nr:hypothetical protein [Prevotella sp. AGR2160]
MVQKKYYIRRKSNYVFVVDNDGNVVYSSEHHSPVITDKHPFISGFTKLFGDRSMERKLRRRISLSPSARLNGYWENVGNYLVNSLDNQHE